MLLYCNTNSGAVVGGGRGGHAPPPIVETVGKLSMLTEIVGKLSMLSEIVKFVDGWGGGGAKTYNVVVRKNFCFVGKYFRFVGKVLPLAPPQKKTWVPRRH